MTSKPKPTATSKKRPQPEKKPVKAAVVAKKAAPVPEKAHKAAAPAPKKGAAPAAKPHGPAHAPAAATIDPKTAAKLLAEKDKKALAARPAGVPEDRQSQLKLLIARGKEQGYLTYAQVNDHLPSEIVDPEPTKKRSRRPPRRSRRWTPNWVARRTRCACTCAKWAPWNC
jgi:hypothetical protein